MPQRHVRLAVDASTLVAEVLRARGRTLLAHPALDLVVAAQAWNETLYELRKRVALLVERGHLEAAPAAQLLDEALSTIAARVTLVPAEAYAGKLEEAQRRIPRDPRDAPTVALALALDCGIWTGDHDFFGSGVPVWTIETLLRHLEAQEGA
jgi:predicted nucleic acid-binding protein